MYQVLSNHYHILLRCSTMISLIGGLVAEAVVGYVEGEIMSKVAGATKDRIGDKKLSTYILDETIKAADAIQVCEETKVVFKSSDSEFRKIRGVFANTIMKHWESDDVDDFVDEPPCKEGTKESVASDLRKLIRAIKDRLWGDERFKELMGSNRFQDVIWAEFQEFRTEINERFEKIESDVSYIRRTLENADGPNSLGLVENFLSPTPYFVGRENEIALIDQKFQESNVVFVKGFGGIGKSELCRVYAFRQRRRRGCKVVWISFFNSIRRTIVSGLRFRQIDESTFKNEDEIYYAKIKALSGERDVLLVIDNYEINGDLSDLEMLTCRVLITTRNLDVQRTSIILKELSLEDTFELLNRCIDPALRQWADNNREGILEVIGNVGRLTVMIPIIAGLINEKHPNPEQLAKDIFGFRDVVSVVKDGKICETDVSGHFQILMDGFHLTDEEEGILEDLSILPSDGIERKLFLSLSGFNSAGLSRLSKFGLVVKKHYDEGIIIQMHPLVAEFIRVRYPITISNDDPRSRIIMNAVDAVDDIIDNSTPVELIPFKDIMASMEASLNGLDIANPAKLMVYVYTINCFSELGLHRESLTYAIKAMEEGESVLNYALMIDLIDHVAEQYSYMDDYQNALYYHQKALEMMLRNLPKEGLSDEQPKVANYYHSIGDDYLNLGNYSKALENLSKAKTILERNPPKNRSGMDVILRSIGSIYSELGDNRKALDHHKRALEIHEKEFSNDDFESSSILNEIGIDYIGLELYQEALECMEKSLAIVESKLPKDHPIIATSMDNIGSAYSDIGDYRTALSYQISALEMRERLSSEEDLNIGLSCSNIATTYADMGNYPEALRYSLRGLEICRKLLPEGHQKIAQQLCNIASI